MENAAKTMLDCWKCKNVELNICAIFASESFLGKFKSYSLAYMVSGINSSLSLTSLSCISGVFSRVHSVASIHERPQFQSSCH